MSHFPAQSASVDLADQRTKPDELKEAALLLLDDHHLQAVELLRAYLKCIPDDRDALSMLGDALYSLGEYQESLSLARQVLRSWPNDYSALSLVAECLDRLGDRIQALGLIETWMVERTGSAVCAEAMTDSRLAYIYWRLLMD